MASPPKLGERPIHLGLGATAIAQPPFTGMEWYAAYGERCGGDGAEGRLVSMHTFGESWDSWEMHPAGHEVVLCTAGEMTLIQEDRERRVTHTTIREGEYAINPPGVWHTADIVGEATAVFITAGLGTEHRPR
jgi:quercetin dioxygenase-like cupin family protein